MIQEARTLFLLLLAAALITLGGAAGYHFLEGWPLGESLYMTVITLSTVGFGEVHPMDSAGQILTVILIFMGIGVIGYAATHFTAVIVSGEIQRQLKGRRMERKIQRTSGHTILCGYGRIGREIAREFMRTGKAIVVIDQGDDSLRDASDDGFLVIQGDATDEHTLQKANIDCAIGLVAALPRDSDNLYIVLTARELNKDLHIAARCLELSNEARLLKAGADKVVNPYVIGGRRLAAVLLHPEIMNFLDLYMQQDPEGFSLRHMRIAPKSRLIGRTLADSKIRQLGHGVMVLGITRADNGHKDMLIPKAETTLLQDDVLILLGNRQMFDALEGEGVCVA